MDHSIPTISLSLESADDAAVKQLHQLETNCRENGIPLFALDAPGRGIVHIIGPELGATQPGMTIVCGDSHTATHGAFGALAFGIGTSEVEQVLATQALLQIPAEVLPREFSRPTGRGRDSERHDPRSDLENRRWRGHRAGVRIRRAGGPGARYGRPHDAVQYVDRGRRARRNGGAG